MRKLQPKPLRVRMITVALKAKALLRILARRNKTQHWLASQMKTSDACLSQLIAGTHSPSPQTRERFLQALDGVTFDELFEIRESQAADGEPVKQEAPVKAVPPA